MFLFSFLLITAFLFSEFLLVGVYGSEVTPVPIPNTEVKLIRVENTWLETTREDRSMPAPNPEFYALGFVIFRGPLAQLVRAPGS